MDNKTLALAMALTFTVALVLTMTLTDILTVIVTLIAIIIINIININNVTITAVLHVTSILQYLNLGYSCCRSLVTGEAEVSNISTSSTDDLYEELSP